MCIMERGIGMSVVVIWPFFFSWGVIFVTIGYIISWKRSRWRDYCSAALIGLGIFFVIFAVFYSIFIPVPGD